jgi:F-type H+-transporting ATPase subunit c
MDEMLYAKGAAYIAAALAIGIGCMAPAIGQGLIGAQACKSMGENPDMAGKIRTTALITMGIVEAAAIYCFLISGVILVLSR